MRLGHLTVHKAAFQWPRAPSDRFGRGCRVASLLALGLLALALVPSRQFARGFRALPPLLLLRQDGKVLAPNVLDVRLPLHSTVMAE